MTKIDPAVGARNLIVSADITPTQLPRSAQPNLFPSAVLEGRGHRGERRGGNAKARAGGGAGPAQTGVCQQVGHSA